MEEYKLLINGKRQEGSLVRETKSPFDQRPVARIHFADQAQVYEAIIAAQRAFEKTKKMSSHERAVVLDKISQDIQSKKEELAESIALSSGKPIKLSRVEVARAVNTFEFAAEEAKRIHGEIIPLDLIPQTQNRWGIVRRFPIGVIAGITPFNFPLNLVAHKVAPALASGNSFILRPASQVAVTSLLLSKIIEATDYPHGGFNVVPSGYDAAEALIEDERVRMITFTGSPTIGWDLKKRAHKKRVTLELGGNAAVIIEPDANLDIALPRTVSGAFSYSGQICISIQRLFLHEKIHDRFMMNFIAETKKLRMGDPLDEATDIGPMITIEAAKQTEEWVAEAVETGAHVLVGGGKEGAMFEPTILANVRPELRISRLEAFAPVVVVYPYKDFDQALEAVNHSLYGLQAGVFTNDLKKAFQAYEVLDVGGVILNDIPTFRIDHMPYGGVKESGFGREGIKYAMEEMTELKLMALNLNI